MDNNVLIEGVNARYCKCNICKEESGDYKLGKLNPFENFYKASKGMYGYAGRCKRYYKQYKIDSIRVYA